LREATDQAQQIHEDELIRRAQADPALFQPLYENYYKLMFRFVLHRIGDRNLTADVTSQVFLKALLNIRKFTFRGLPFSAWLYRVAINECNEFFRRHKRERLVVLEDVSAGALYEEVFFDDNLEEWKEKLPAILRRLNADELQVIELRFLEDRPFREVAHILGITESHAKVKTYRILRKMKNIFTKRVI
jgi:RNA polymerase sigma-70 factor, ECF subfamily